MPKKIQQFKRRTDMTARRHVRHIKRLAKKPLFTIPLATFMALLVVGMVSLLVFNGGTPKLKTSDSNIVILDYDKQRQTVPTRAKTVGALLDKLAIHLNSGDVVEPSRDTEIVGDNFRVNVYRAVPVTVIDGESKTFAYSAAATPRSIVKQAGVQVYPEDDLKLLPTENFLTDSSIGERVVINRATPVNVNLYGTPVSLRTHAKTVAALLKEKGITLHEGDTVQPVESTPLTANTQVFVTHKGKQIVSTEEQVAMPTQTVEDDSLSFGVTAVRQQGSVGKKVITYEIELQNGVEVGRRAIQEVVTQQPVTQIIAKGTYVNIAKDHTSVMAAAGIAKSDYVYVEYVIEHESHWNLASVNSAGCSGLGQACPGSKLAAACPAWRTDAICQMKFFNGYAVDRYGTWAAAYNFKVSHGWW
jgi:uncharacterized protein YabE (DUF348 family)